MKASPAEDLSRKGSLALLGIRNDLRLLSLYPFRFESRISQPLHRPKHGMNGLFHVREVEMAHVVAGAMIISVQAEAGDGLRDNPFFGKSVIV